MTETPQSERPTSERPQTERLAKVIAAAGVCSRRDAERWIAAGRVTLDGRPVTRPATNVAPGQRVEVDGRPLPDKPEPRLWRLHKPAGVITAARDPQERRTIHDLLPRELPRVMPVGRLDLNSEGLLLLTNDGALKRRLELPAMGWRRRYRVRAFGRADPERLAALARGLTLEGVHYGPIEAELERQSGANAWLLMTLKEGKNREIRKVCAHLGLKVNRLIRIAYGPLQLGRLKPGELREVPRRVLAEQLGEVAPEKRDRKGHARPKPKPVKPGHRKAAARRRAAKADGTGKAGAGSKTARKPAHKPAGAPKAPGGGAKGRHADRRRPS